MESLIIRRVLVVSVMPKRRKDSAICGGKQSGQWIGVRWRKRKRKKVLEV